MLESSNCVRSKQQVLVQGRYAECDYCLLAIRGRYAYIIEDFEECDEATCDHTPTPVGIDNDVHQLGMCRQCSLEEWQKDE